MVRVDRSLRAGGGVQALATNVRAIVNDTRTHGRRADATDGLNISTTSLLNRYLVRLVPPPSSVPPSLAYPSQLLPPVAAAAVAFV